MKATAILTSLLKQAATASQMNALSPDAQNTSGSPTQDMFAHLLSQKPGGTVVAKPSGPAPALKATLPAPAPKMPTITPNTVTHPQTGR